MNIFHFHRDSGLYIGSDTADESPLEPGVFLIPAYATNKKPPAFGLDEQAFFINDAWVIRKIPQPEPAAVPTLEQLKAAKNTEINTERAAANCSTFIFSGKAFSCDMLSRGDIDGINGYVALYAALPPSFPGAWKAVDNSVFPIPDVNSWKTFYAAMVAAGAANFAHSQQLKTTLAAATTAEQVAAIVW